jgi:DNA invertase Pin-like site-specific DNA recombinase
MPTLTSTLTAREYLRVSQDRSGRARSVDEQHTDNVLAGQTRGFSFTGDSYSDVDVSASRFTTKVRGGFDRLISDLCNGRFCADLLVVWESSRGSRRVREWLDLIEACEAAGVRIFVTTHGREYDPANARDVRSLQEDAVDSQYESAKISDRGRRAAAASAAAGRPHGRVMFGYERRYHPLTRALVAQEPRPDEAAVVVEIFTRLGKGHSLRAIAIDFEARGVRTRSGKLFDASHIRDVALKPAYAGLRVHAPEENANGRHTGPLGDATEATWPALVDRELYFKVRTMLLDPGRRSSRPGRAKHLMSLIATCGVCRKSGMSVAYRHGNRIYQCRNSGCVQIRADALDSYAEEVMLAYLSRDDVIEELRAGRPDGGELAQVRVDLAEARSELASWHESAASGRISLKSLEAAEPRLTQDVVRLEVRERELSTPSALLVIEPGKDVARRWEAAPMAARRQVARMLCSPEVLGTLRVERNPVPLQRTPPEDRVAWNRD